jgi:hypothetical protein
MELEDTFFARFADLTPDGLFTVVGGGVNRINASSFPWSWGFMFLLARCRLTIEEAKGQHMLAIERETPNGHTEPIGAEFPMTHLQSAPEIGPDGKVGFSLNYCLVNLIFLEAGLYKYRLKIDGRDMGVANLLVTGPAK